MSYSQEHIKSCDFCSKKYTSENENRSKPTVRIKAASSYNKQKKLSELGAIIRGTSYPSVEPISTFKTKGGSGSKPSYLERQFKLKELAKMIRG